jgi:hypothetical protein
MLRQGLAAKPAETSAGGFRIGNCDETVAGAKSRGEIELLTNNHKEFGTVATRNRHPHQLPRYEIIRPDQRDLIRLHNGRLQLFHTNRPSDEAFCMEGLQAPQSSDCDSCQVKNAAQIAAMHRDAVVSASATGEGDKSDMKGEGPACPVSEPVAFGSVPNTG